MFIFIVAQRFYLTEQIIIIIIIYSTQRKCTLFTNNITKIMKLWKNSTNFNVRKNEK